MKKDGKVKKKIAAIVMLVFLGLFLFLVANSFFTYTQLVTTHNQIIHNQIIINEHLSDQELTTVIKNAGRCDANITELDFCLNGCIGMFNRVAGQKSIASYDGIWPNEWCSKYCESDNWEPHRTVIAKGSRFGSSCKDLDGDGWLNECETIPFNYNYAYEWE